MMPRDCWLALLVVALVAACTPAASGDGEGARETKALTPAEAAEQGLAVATFAGGCFWCMEPPFDELAGVQATISGYSGGPEEDPTYEEVSSGATGHAEVVRVVYDPEEVSYEELLDVYWRNVDPTVKDRQFCDWGSQYRTAIYTHGEEQHRLAVESRRRLRESKPFEGEIVTEIEPAGAFWPAEEYHQDFYEKSQVRYTTYRQGCGRDARLEELWGEGAGGH